MPKFDRRILGKQARELGFVRDTLEKVYRLSEILNYFNVNPKLHDAFAIKGGTAINLTIFTLPRLSVDLDFDYIHNDNRDAMLLERSHLADNILKYMAANDYSLSPKSKNTHSLDSFVFTYINAGGVNDNIKIEINYSLRAHILQTENRKMVKLGFLDQFSIHTLAIEEIFGSKIVALLSRAAARDLYDIYRMALTKFISKEQYPMVRKCAIFYSAISGDMNLNHIPFENIDRITKNKIRTDLLPVIRTTDEFDLSLAQETVKQFITELLQIDEQEMAFIQAFHKKEYRPDFLFEDEEILKRIKDHPMALWKTKK